MSTAANEQGKTIRRSPAEWQRQIERCAHIIAEHGPQFCQDCVAATPCACDYGLAKAILEVFAEEEVLGRREA